MESTRLNRQYSSGMWIINNGQLYDPVTWYKITRAGTQDARWDFQNKAARTSPPWPAFVLELPLCNLGPSMCDFVHQTHKMTRIRRTTHCNLKASNCVLTPKFSIKPCKNKLFNFASTISKTSTSVSSRFPNTRKQMKARAECFYCCRVFGNRDESRRQLKSLQCCILPILMPCMCDLF